MSSQDYLKEEIEYLRKRSWDLISKLEQLQSEYEKTADADKQLLLKNRVIKNKKLLNDYKAEYQELCDESGFTQEMLTPNVKQDFSSKTREKSNRTLENIQNKEKSIELAPFFNVPSRNEDFTGRKDRVRQFIQRILDGGAFAICGVKGMGGIGKTEIAKEVCHLFHNTWNNKSPQLPDDLANLLGSEPLFADGILWIQFERDNQSPKILTEYILNKITDTQTADKIASLPKLADILATKNVLVVLDSVEQNLRTFDYVHEIFKGRFPLIITSRIEIPGIQSIDIDSLKDKEAYNLFVKQLPSIDLTDLVKQEIKDLCKILGNFPLAIKIIASRVNVGLSNISSLLKDYEKNKVLLLEEKGSGLELEQQNINVNTCFSMSLNQLNAFEKKVFMYCAIFNNPFEVIHLADLLDEGDCSEVKEVVTKLVDISLLNLLMQSTKVVTSKKQEIEALIEQLEQTDNESLLQLLKNKTALQQIVDAIIYCDSVFDFSMVMTLMRKVNEPLDILGYWQQKIKLNRLMVRATIALQNQNSQAFYRRELAETIARKAMTKPELQEAEKAFKQALISNNQLNKTNEILFIQYWLSAILGDLNKFTNSVISNAEGIRLAEKYANLQKHGVFNKANADIYNKFLLDKGSLIFKINFNIIKIDVREGWQKQNVVRSYYDLISVQYNRGNIDYCLPYLDKQLEISIKLQSTELILSTIKSLFECHFHLQQTEACQRYCDDYTEVSMEMEINEHTRQLLYSQLAYLKADYSTAIKNLSLLISDDNLEQEIINYWLGKAYLRHNDLSQAEHYLNETLTFYQQQNNSHEIANVYIELAWLALNRNQFQIAINYLGVALKTKQVLGCQLLPEQESVKQAIITKISLEDGFEQYQALLTEAEPLNLIPDFILQNIPETYIAKDEKKMRLIPESGAFVGQGEIKSLSEEEILNNIDSIIEGNNEGNEKTATEIYLYPYYIDQTTVNNTEYQLFCLETSHPLPEHWHNDEIPKNTELLPVVNISLDDAKAYAKWADKEIPISLEWEKACRGEQGLLYPWGNDWDNNQVKVKADIRKHYEDKFTKIIEPVIGKGVTRLGETPLIEISPSPLVSIDEEKFVNLLEGSLSLDRAEKQRVIDKMPTLSQFQVDELTRVWEEEQINFTALEKDHPEDVALLKRRAYDHFNLPLLANTATDCLNQLEENSSPYGIYNMVGNIYEMTETEVGENFLIKGGSWFSKNPKENCLASASETITNKEKRIDVGFRCVKPIFSNDDINALKSS